MGQKHSKDQLLYQYVINGDIEGIRYLSKQGASLEWKDKQGSTPLILTAGNPGLYSVANTLIELGANVNAYRKGRQGGAPLHYAAKEGLDRMVALLLSHGANAFVKNHEHQTPLDVARKNGRKLVVREIESRICYFAGYIREAYGPGFSDASASQMSSRLIWVVVVPRSPHNPPKRPKLELVIYSTPEDAEPRRIISLKKSKIKKPRFDQPSPAMIIFDKRTKTRYKFSPVSYSDKQQLRRLYNACKGISQVVPASAQTGGSEPWDSHPQMVPGPEFTMTANAYSQPTGLMSGRNSLDYTVGNSRPNTWKSPGRLSVSPPMTPSSNVWVHESPRGRNYTGHQSISESWSAPNVSPHRGSQPTAVNFSQLQKPGRSPTADVWVHESPRGRNQINQGFSESWSSPNMSPHTGSQATAVNSPKLQTPDRFPVAGADTVPSAPPVITDSTNTQFSANHQPDSSSCVICWDAPVEAACVPCGHVSSCMSCLQEIKGKDGACPVCRAHIDQVIKLYGI